MNRVVYEGPFTGNPPIGTIVQLNSKPPVLPELQGRVAVVVGYLQRTGRPICRFSNPQPKLIPRIKIFPDRTTAVDLWTIARRNLKPFPLPKDCLDNHVLALQLETRVAK